MTTPLTITSLDQGKIFVHPFDRADAARRAQERAGRDPAPIRRQPGFIARVASLLRLASQGV